MAVMHYNISKLIRKRMELGISKNRLAAKAGLTPKTICNVESGAGAREETVKAIADALEMEMSELIEPDDSGQAA